MKTSMTNAHDYMTLRVTGADKAKLNLTTSWRGARCSTSAFPNTAGEADLSAAFKAHKDGSLKTFLKGPQRTSFKAWMDAVQAHAERSSTFAQFFDTLGAALVACDVKAVA